MIYSNQGLGELWCSHRPSRLLQGLTPASARTWPSRQPQSICPVIPRKKPQKKGLESQKRCVWQNLLSFVWWMMWIGLSVAVQHLAVSMDRRVSSATHAIAFRIYKNFPTSHHGLTQVRLVDREPHRIDGEGIENMLSCLAKLWWSTIPFAPLKIMFFFK